MFKSRTRLWGIGTAVVCLALLLAANFLVVAPRRAQAAELTTQRESVIASNTQLQARISQLKTQAKTLSQREAELAVIQKQMPPALEMSQFLRDVETIAGESGVVLISVQPAGAVELTAGAATSGATMGTTSSTAAAAGSASPSASPSASASSKGSTSGSAAGSTTGSATGSTASGGAAGTTAAAPSAKTIAVPINIVVKGDYFQAALFLKKVQTELNRLMLIGNIAVSVPDAAATTGKATGQVSVKIDGQIYVYQPADAAGGGITGASTSGTAATSPTTTGSASGPTTSGGNS